MKVNAFAATALLAIGATGLTAGTVNAQPAPVTETAVRGIEQGIEYTAAPAADGPGAITTVAAGSFALTGDAQAVTLSDSAGNVVVTLPLAFQTVGAKFGLTPQISDAGRTLTLTPIGAQVDTQQNAQFIDEADTLARKQYNAGIGALIGAGIGAVIGFFLGGVGALVTIPIGAGIGALIGFATP
ncbi:hypothetical protein [Nocardia sp. NBC_01009]|uniref:hypothetical protein n=1 Tax=Nocardia sp. NBC_01009 TaxID=2975996 RepID=UPI00386A9C36|nr:hypothetical protein OHA42_33735 [Nocardia sp. NBC_01009]